MLGHEVVGILLLLFSLVCLGTWPALLRICSFGVEGQGNNVYDPLPSSSQGRCHLIQRIRARNVCHVYLDYASTYVIVSTLPLLLALGLSSHGSSSDHTYTDDKNSAQNGNVMTFPLIATAMLGGALLSFGNLSFQWATAVYGAPLTTILAMQASLTVILGTSLNYILQPDKTPHPGILLSGVFVFLLAIALATLAQLVYAHEQQKAIATRQHANGFHNNHPVTASPVAVAQYATIELPYGSRNNNSVLKHKESDVFTVVDDDGNDHDDTVMFVQNRNMKALLVALMGGLAFGFFSPAFNVAVNDPFHWSNIDQAAGVDQSLLVFYANLWFSLAFGAASVVGNLILLKMELNGQSLTEIMWTYLTGASWTERRVALLAGIVCAVGNILQFHGGQLVGYATADLVQAYPLVSTLWDILWFGEFAHVKWCWSRFSFLLVGMYLAYLGGIVLLAVSSVE